MESRLADRRSVWFLNPDSETGLPKQRHSGLKNADGHGANGQFKGRSLDSRDQLVLTAIGDRALLRTLVLGPGVKRHSHFFGALQGPADISILRTGIERNQPVAVLAVRLESIADFLRPLPEYLGAFRALDSYFFLNHEMSPKINAGILPSIL
jgi:hypothetical protein